MPHVCDSNVTHGSIQFPVNCVKLRERAYMYNTSIVLKGSGVAKFRFFNRYFFLHRNLLAIFRALRLRRDFRARVRYFSAAV